MCAVALFICRIRGELASASRTWILIWRFSEFSYPAHACAVFQNHFSSSSSSSSSSSYIIHHHHYRHRHHPTVSRDHGVPLSWLRRNDPSKRASTLQYLRDPCFPVTNWQSLAAGTQIMSLFGSYKLHICEGEGSRHRPISTLRAGPGFFIGRQDRRAKTRGRMPRAAWGIKLPPHPLGGPGEWCELHQRGWGWAVADQMFFTIFSTQDCLS